MNADVNAERTRNTLITQRNEAHCICSLGGRRVQVLVWGKQPSERSYTHHSEGASIEPEGIYGHRRCTAHRPQSGER
jgi:hypothetical protein